MNYYERIQSSIDFIESHLTDDFTVQEVADAAYMSVANFYRMFLSLVGYTVKEYIRGRRLSLAADELCNADTTGMSVLDIAVKYGYTSADSFARAFKASCGFLPSKFKLTQTEQKKTSLFKRIHIMDTIFEETQSNGMDSYPDIKVIKELSAMKVACFSYYGANPEEHAFARMKDWVESRGTHFNSGYRIFGYNNPDPVNVDDPTEIYAYEVCVTIDNNEYAALADAPVVSRKHNATYDDVKRKTLPGGRYAVVALKRNKDEDFGIAIMNGWKRFNAWLSISKYTWGASQYLEEHLGFSDDDEHTGGVELYMPIIEKQQRDCMTLRLAKESEVEALTTISTAAFHSDYDVGGKENDGPPNYNNSQWHQTMRKQGHLYAAIIDSQIVGGALLFIDAHTKDTLVIGRIFIAPALYRKGYGIALMQHIEQLFNSITTYQLDTPVWNVRTNAFYKKAGYTEMARDSESVYFQKIITQ